MIQKVTSAPVIHVTSQTVPRQVSGIKPQWCQVAQVKASFPLAPTLRILVSFMSVLLVNLLLPPSKGNPCLL